mmetsp:Transcript_43421/g.122848  ORF Transcript_43421/g.122848 Transcript_43421/m.122848 type:complete len:259 (-) Transcript_43421:1314-2090(-)
MWSQTSPSTFPGLLGLVTKRETSDHSLHPMALYALIEKKYGVTSPSRSTWKMRAPVSRLIADRPSSPCARVILATSSWSRLLQSSSSANSSSATLMSYFEMGSPLWCGTNHFSSIHDRPWNSLRSARGVCGTSDGIRVSSLASLQGEVPQEFVDFTRKVYFSPGASWSIGRVARFPLYRIAAVSAASDADAHSRTKLPDSSMSRKVKEVKGSPLFRPILKSTSPVVSDLSDTSDRNSGATGSYGESGSVAQAQLPISS